MRIEPQELRIGDIFVEDPYDDEYEVIRLETRGHLQGAIARDLKNNSEVFFGGSGAYAPVLYLINRP